MADDSATARSGERAVFDEVARLEAIFTVFDTDSELHRLRRSGSTDVAELQTVVELAGQWWQRTGGVFHPGAQLLVDLWDRAETAGVAPSVDVLEQAVAALEAPISPGLHANFNGNLNLNAIAKGWIAEFALRNVIDSSRSVRSAWLSLGGDVVHCGDDSVVVGIEDPHRPFDNVAPLATVVLSNEALATSGGARRWWTIGKRRYSKVLDPRSGRPVDHIASATIIAPDGATADALATVALVLKVEETLRLVEDAKAQCLLIDEDGLVTSSSDRFRPS